MATTPTKPGIDVTPPFPELGVPGWPETQGGSAASAQPNEMPDEPSRHDAVQALLAFSALHQQVRRRRALATRANGFDAAENVEFEAIEHYILDEVLQLVAERAVAITGADGLAIALAEKNEIVLRASAGTVKPDLGTRIDRESAFSGACFRMAQIFRCDDAELDPRVNLRACRKLGARSMVAVPLCGRRRVIGVLEAFSRDAYGFNDSDVINLSLLAELVLAALKPEDEDRFAESARVAATELEAGPQSGTKVSPPEKVALVKASEAAAAVAVPAAAAKAAVSDAAVAGAAEVVEQPAIAVKEAVIAAKSADLGVAVEEPTRRHTGLLVALVAVVVVAMAAGGAWWKIKNVQLSRTIVHPKDVASKAEPAGQESAVPTPAPATPSPETAAEANANPDSLPAPAEPASSAPTPQELSKFPQVTGIRHWSAVDSSTIVLDLEDQVQYEAHRITKPDRIYFDLHDTALAAELSAKTIDVGDPLLNRIRVAQPVSGMTRVVLETRGNSNFSVSLEPNPYRLVVQVRKVGANPKAAVNLFPNEVEAEMNKLAIVVPPPTKEDLQLRARVPKMRVVVDAGHGGWDLGTVGRRGLLEKDLVLEIARRLGKLLQTRLGSEVIYTRQDDNYIPLDERAEMANQAQADLFVSVHANYSDLPSARGVETYYTNFFSSPDSKNKEMPENSSSNGVKAVLSPAQLHLRIEQSRRLAASVQRSLYGTLSVKNPGLRDRGVKEAGFVVLTETAMPGILAEVSFVSSPTDEQRLRSDGYREQIAEALYKGIARYAASSHGVKMASAAK